MELAFDLTARDELIDQYRLYTERVVASLMRLFRLPPDRHDEFISAAYLGLVEAASRFDFTAGTSFRSFAFLRIRGAIIDSIRQSVGVSGKAYRKIQALEAANDLREQLASESDPERRATASERLSRILDHAVAASLSYRLTLRDAELEISTRSEIPLDPASILESRELVKKIRQFVATLPENERNVITDYYFRGLPFAQIAESYGRKSKSWVSRLHRRALGHLQEQVLAYHAGFPAPSKPEPVVPMGRTRVPRRTRRL